MLIALSGLPGVGKSTIARELARQVDGVWLRIDSIEMAIFAAIPITGGTADLGYRVAHAVAEDNLRLGRTVVADAVNPWMLTRDAWRAVGVRSGARVVEIEIVCSDVAEHRRRFETRTDAPGLGAPDWETVTNRDYRPGRATAWSSTPRRAASPPASPTSAATCRSPRRRPRLSASGGRRARG